MAAIHALTGQELAGEYNETPPATVVQRVAQAILRPERR
jgi:1-acyl-sn-glycerol-3-phosphate acyltransferase